MLTERENLEEVIKRGNPERFANQYDAFAFVRHPILKYRNQAKPGEIDKINDWGCTVSWPIGQPGAFPNHREDLIVMPDITHWKETVHAPKSIYPESEWEEFIEQAEKIDRKKQFVTAMEMPGVFELTHYLGEITRILTDFYEYPQEMKDLIKYITEWELNIAEGICTYIKPDAMFHHDDWGTNTSTFLAPDMFAEFFVDAYKQIYGYYHDHGVKYVVHHSDSYAETLVPYMIEMGINVWQGVMSTNDIPKMIDQYGDKITFMGGIDSTIVDIPDWTPEKIRAQVKKTCDENGPLSFIPSQTQGLNLSSYPEVYGEIGKAISEYSTEYFKTFDRKNFKDFSAEQEKIVVDTEAKPAEKADEAPEEGGSIFDEISEAVQHGKRKDVKALVQKAVDDGCSPEDILNKGLVAAMSIIGDKFSAGEVFVPEMLIAARAMGAGTKVLKPYLTEEGTEPIGKAIIGTVKGDQHDIGKNLVRMMIEGKGFEVTDLGTDVPAETFVSFLQEHDDVDIVCCSALLTTTVPEINTTIKAIEEAGLRDQVKIMIGGAPVTQAYADEVGADAYTEDAGQAAVRAVELLSEK